ncbi:MAG: dTDP-4-dehydrorhamnose 3,5-epimerase [Oscillospiraceae bacterium]|nr:dTDP-4-dehydrorhamnose 3,5-epimerase [Oscillospiraceae bacterium]
MKFKFIDTGIADLYVVEPTVFGDDRGYFMETYNAEFQPYVKHLDGSPAVYVQDNQSRSKRGVLRGLHSQRTHPQGKLVRVTEGEVYDVAVDMRRDSATFGKWYGAVLSEENKLQFLIPEGFLHGFVVMSEFATFTYKCTNFYVPDDESGIAWDDPDIAVDWNIPEGMEIILSEKDKHNPTLRQSGLEF